MIKTITSSALSGAAATVILGAMMEALSISCLDTLMAIGVPLALTLLFFYVPIALIERSMNNG